MSILSSPNDFDPRILANEPLMFLNWYNNPDVVMYRQARKPIPLSTRAVRAHHRLHMPLTNEQILSIKTHYYLEWQLLTIASVALVVCYFLFNPLLLFFVRFESDSSLSAQYASLLFLVFYGFSIVSIVFWMVISRLSIWHANFNTAAHYVEESKRAQSTTSKHSQRQSGTLDDDDGDAGGGPEDPHRNPQRAKRRRKKRRKDKAGADDVDSESDDDDAKGDSDMDDETKEEEFINDQTRKMKQGSAARARARRARNGNNSLTTATTRVTGLILSLRWSLFGYALSLGLFAACTSFEQLVIVCAISGAFFPALLISSSNVIVYGMKRLPSVRSDLKRIFYIISFGWIFLPLVTCIIGEYGAYRWPFVFGALLILGFLGWSMFCQPGQATISMIADAEADSSSLMDDMSETGPVSIGLNQSLTGASAGYDDTTPLTIGHDSTYDDDDESSVTSDASSIFRMPGDHDVPLPAGGAEEQKDGRPVRDAQAKENQRVRYENELKRAGIDTAPVSEDLSGRPRCLCLESPIMRNSCTYNHRLMSSSMGIFQIATFLLLIQSFSVDLCVSCYLTWYPIVMHDHFGQRFVLSGVQMMITGAVVVFFATWVARRNTAQFFLYSVNTFASFFVILLSICMIEFGDVLFYWFVFPLVMGCIVLIGMISRMMLSRITPNGCLSFINGSSQIFHLAAYGIGPLILGIIDGYDEQQSDYYFFALICSVLTVHVFTSIGLYLLQLGFTAIKVWGLATYQNRP